MVRIQLAALVQLGTVEEPYMGYCRLERACNTPSSSVGVGVGEGEVEEGSTSWVAWGEVVAGMGSDSRVEVGGNNIAFDLETFETVEEGWLEKINRKM